MIYMTEALYYSFNFIVFFPENMLTLTIIYILIILYKY